MRAALVGIACAAVALLVSLTLAPRWAAACGGGMGAPVWLDGAVQYGGGVRARPGRTEYVFYVQDPRVRVLEVDFAHPLDGARIEAVGYGGARYPLDSRERVGGARVCLEWPHAELTAVSLYVHQHLRRTPVVRAVRGGYRKQ